MNKKPQIVELHHDRLYNLETTIGWFKLKTIPKEFKELYPSSSIWRVSAGEGENYYGGKTVKSAFNNMLKKQGTHQLITGAVEWGKRNNEFVNLETENIYKRMIKAELIPCKGCCGNLISKELSEK